MLTVMVPVSSATISSMRSWVAIQMEIPNIITDNTTTVIFFGRITLIMPRYPSCILERIHPAGELSFS